MSQKDADLNTLEARFHQDMLDTYKLLKREYHHHASYFLQMLLELGGRNRDESPNIRAATAAQL